MPPGAFLVGPARESLADHLAAIIRDELDRVVVVERVENILDRRLP